MSKSFRFNAFTMNTVGHQSPGRWTHPRDRCGDYRKLELWSELAALLERGLFDGVFIAAVLGIYDVYGANPEAAIRHAVQACSIARRRGPSWRYFGRWALFPACLQYCSRCRTG